MSEIVEKMVKGLSAEELAALWWEAKQGEQRAVAYRLKIEKEIESRVKLPDEGTTKIESLTITTGFDRKWDNDGLMLFREGFPDELWPFKVKWAEERRGTRWLEENSPDLWDQISPALTIKSKKPAYAWKGEKNVTE